MDILKVEQVLVSQDKQGAVYFFGEEVVRKGEEIGV
jgi:fructose-1-phosphate kinase PfkB-like protein